MSKHLELIRAVNAAKAESEHLLALGKLYGWRDCMESFGRRWSSIEADDDTEALYPGRPCCCGVLLDWEPEKHVIENAQTDNAPEVFPGTLDSLEGLTIRPNVQVEGAAGGLPPEAPSRTPGSASLSCGDFRERKQTCWKQKKATAN